MISELERKVINALNGNARKSFREVAKETGTSVTAVIGAVKNLEARGAIRGYIPAVDPGQAGFELSAVIAVRISQGKLLETQKKIAEDARVAAVFDVTGEWDSIVLARFRNREDLSRFIKKINAVPHVDRTITHLVLNTIKDERRIYV